VAGIVPRFRMIETPEPSPDPDVRRFTLRGLDDTPGSLTFTRRPGGLIEIHCTNGRFGEPERAYRFVRALAHRFSQLRGEVAAPIDEP
jgi:hypothetical protein